MTTRAICAMVMAGACVVLVACGAGDRGTTEIIDDVSIVAQANAALLGESILSASRINVESHNGDVQLSGFVNEAEMRALAESKIRAIEGVRDVRNDIQIQPKPANRTLEDLVDDGVLAARVNAALIGNPVTSAIRIGVESVNNVVQLSGFVATDEERAEAGRVVGEVEGVREVRNDIQVTSEK